MKDSDLEYDTHYSAFKHKETGNYYRLVDGEYKLLNEIHMDTSRGFDIIRGKVVYLTPAEQREQNIYIQPSIENTLSQIDKDIFKLTWEEYALKYSHSIDDLIKYLVVHPDRRPAGTDLVLHKNNKKDRNKVLNPLTNGKIKKGSPEYKSLMKIYNNQDDSRAMIPIPENEINWYYVNSGDDDNGKLFKKYTTNRKPNPKFAKLLKTSVLHENILFVPTIKPIGTSLNTNLKRFNIEPHMEMVVDNIHAPIIRDIIYNGSKCEFTVNQATTLLISFELRLQIQRSHSGAPVEESTNHQIVTQYVTTITYNHNKDAFLKQLLNDILKVQTKYHGSEHIHFILLLIKIASFNNILVGGCNLEITGMIQDNDTSTFFKFNNGYIRYVKNVIDNNCLPIIFIERERTINKDRYINRFPTKKQRHSMEDKNILMNNLRTNLNLEHIAQMMSVGSIDKLAKEFKINVKLYHTDITFKCHGEPLEEIQIVLINNHYFEYYPEGHQYYEIASKRCKNTYEELWQEYCNKTEPIKSLNEPTAPLIETIEEPESKINKISFKKSRHETLIGPKPEKKSESKPSKKSETIVGPPQPPPVNTRSTFFWISPNTLTANQTIAIDSEIVFLKITFKTNTSIPQSYCFQHEDSIFNYSDENMSDLFIDYCLNNRIKYIVTYGGATRDLFPLYHAIIKHPVAEISDNKFDLIYSNSTFYKMTFNGITTVDLKLFIKSELNDVCTQLKLPFVNEPSFYVSVLRNVFTHFEKETFTTYKSSLLRYSSSNAMAYDFWMNTMDLIDGHTCLARLTPQQYNIVIKAKYGAYFYPLKFYYKTGFMNIDDVLKNMHFLRKVDASGCYSYAMYNHRFPIGEAYLLNSNDITAINDALKRGITNFKKLGVYEVTYVCPKNLRRPVLPKHDDDGLLWDLVDGRGFFSSPLIAHAIKKGYKILEVHSGVTWTDTSSTLFNKFIEVTYVLKQLSSMDPIKSSMAKQMCNSLYGKLLEALGDLDRKLCTKIDHVTEFIRKGKPIDLIFNDDDTVHMFSKQTMPTEKNIRKPYQLGIFVLDYARIYMDELVDFLDIDEVPFYSIFTDSIYITQKQYENLENSEYFFKPIPHELTDDEHKKQWILKHQLGKFRDDLGGYILEANFYRPNICRFRYLNTKTQSIEEKCKYPGIPAHMINFNDFDFDDKKYNFQANSSLSLDNSSKPLLTAMTKTISNNLWNRMMVVNPGNEEWYPFGYEF
jgi:hypothetical protein